VRQVEKTVGAVDVLVAARAINLGDSVSAEDFRWQQWPSEGFASGLISKASDPEAPTKLSGAIARASFITGEPIKEQKLIKTSEGGVMAAILPSGMRAISTPIREETSAGGFILPNDRVDVILSHKVRVGNKEEPVSEAVLRNVRVLAIGQTRSALRQAGIPSRTVMLEPYYANGDHAAPLHLSYLRAVAQGPECPDWSENVGRDPQNMPYPNLGCATQANFAAMVDNPNDLIEPRIESVPASAVTWCGAST
jgi:Flp pilus assembly protein CpaB